MSANFGASSGGGRGSQSQDVELNLASIIDCFTVLIAFMLVSAAFVSIGILDAGVAAAGAQSAGNTPPSVQVTVELSAGHKLSLKTLGKETKTYELPAKDGAWDHAALQEQLTGLKQRYNDIAAVTLVADNAIEYKEVIKAMEMTRKVIPVVLLGGF